MNSTSIFIVRLYSVQNEVVMNCKFQIFIHYPFILDKMNFLDFVSIDGTNAIVVFGSRPQVVTIK